jgi:hypothetical protein
MSGSPASKTNASVQDRMTSAVTPITCKLAWLLDLGHYGAGPAGLDGMQTP